ncbi:MAG: hypothetical protein IPN70_01745 [Candidatus Moraniibacteriota bacterium]|nr:MAG: hypothetical protein IPN70_01745 [Candidatus Moranbacteria bacterium]
MKTTTFKTLLLIGIIIVVAILMHVLIIQPHMERNAYKECLDALQKSPDYLSAKSTNEKEFLLEVCAKSRGAIDIQAENRKREEVIQNTLNEESDRNTIDADKLSLLSFQLEQSSDPYNAYNTHYGNKFAITGKIQNNNSYPIEKLSIKIDFFDSEGNKFDEHDEELTNVIYENSFMDFNEEFYMKKVDPNSDFTYTYEIISGKKR